MLKEYPADRLVVTCMHIPLRNYLTGRSGKQHGELCRDFLKLISGRPNTISLSGHTHTTEHHYFGAEDGFAGPVTPPPSCDDCRLGLVVERSLRSPRHCGRRQPRRQPERLPCSFDQRTKLFDPFQPANEPNARQMRIMLDCDFHRDRKELYREFRMGALLGSPIAQGRVICDRT